MSFFSSIYGLGIAINQRIPGIRVSESTDNVDVKVSLGSTPTWFDKHTPVGDIWYSTPTQKAAPPRLVIWKLSDGRYYRLRYADGTEFLVDSDGTEVWGTWPSNKLTLEDAATYLLGPILGFVLLLRGSICLHASAVAVGKQAIALVGPAGSGKSTTAAAFADRGYGILAEDVLTLHDQGSAFWVQPGYPCIRLWPHSVETLYGAPDELPKLTPTWDKCFLDLSQDKYKFHEQPLPLAVVYMLGTRSEDSNAPCVSGLSPAGSLMSLVANTYATNLMDKEMRSREFELLSRLVSHVPVRRLIPSSKPEHIGRLCDTIINDFETSRAHV